jgi:hypothetical protein
MTGGREMVAGATETADQRLDELVPPPWGPGRRAAATGAGVVIVLVLIGAVVSGSAGPRLSHGMEPGWSVDGADRDALAVQRIVPVRNDGWLPVTLDGFEPPPLEHVTWGRTTGLPAVVDPGDTHEVTIGLVVHGCDVDLAGFDVVPIRAASGIAPARIVEIPADSQPTMRTTYETVDGSQPVTLPIWPDQPPSWILDSIEPVCSTPPDRMDH